MAMTQPAQLQQKDTAIAFVKFDLLRVWVAEVVAHTFLFEVGKALCH